DGRMLALNSYENRVYQAGMEEAEPLVVKFYRPNRWSNEQILEEHGFAEELAEAEIPLVAPLRIQGQTLHVHQGYRFALFPRRGGRAPELDQSETRLWLGRFLGRIHAIGGSRKFAFRPKLDPALMARQALDYLRQGDWLPAHLHSAFFSLADDLLRAIDRLLAQCGELRSIR
ncbi:MAG: serine/threonine protein kinase, partial [Gammaproteobacteria bacterium]|nr:serine/threonine protein kinase [Gammaproteobacteria bacterium]